MAAPRPLAGVRVVDTTTILAGPYCTYQLALLGADVIKIERPGRGDWIREGASLPGFPGVSASFAAQNADKRCITLDLKDPRGLVIAKRLVAGADVFVENFAPGVAARLGLGWEPLVAVNPRLVYTSLSGFGQDGEFSPRPAYDHVIQAMSGVTTLIGTPETIPNRIGPPMFDYLAGIYGATATLAALRERDRTGTAQRADVAMLDAGLAAMASFVSQTLNTPTPPRPVGNTAASGSPASGIFETADGLLALAANQDHQARALIVAIGRGDLLDDPRFATTEARLAHFAAFQVELRAALRARSAAEWETLLAAVRVPASRVRTLPETLAEPHVATRGVVAPVRDDATGAAMQVPTAGYKLNGATLAPATPPRALGADTDAVLAELGLANAEIATLRRDGVI